MYCPTGQEQEKLGSADVRMCLDSRECSGVCFQASSTPQGDCLRSLAGYTVRKWFSITVIPMYGVSNVEPAMIKPRHHLIRILK